MWGYDARRSVSLSEPKGILPLSVTILPASAPCIAGVSNLFTLIKVRDLENVLTSLLYPTNHQDTIVVTI